MRRTAPAVVALLLVASAVAVVPMAMAQQTETETNRTAGNDTAEPGAQLSGVIAVGEAELDGEVEDRAYGIRIAEANSSAAKAAVVAEQVNATERRVDALAAERAELEAARENGSMREAQYRSRVAALHAESVTAARMVNRTNETASGLPAETLEANGVDVTAIRSLSDRAQNLTGPETAEIARSVAGSDAGQPALPDRAANRTDAGSDRPAGETGPDRPTPDRSGETGSATATNETTSPDAQ